jgi:hypothetical protein
MEERERTLCALEQVVPYYIYDQLFGEVNDSVIRGSGTTTYRICSFITSNGEPVAKNAMYGGGFRHKHIYDEAMRRDEWYHIAGEVERFQNIGDCLRKFGGPSSEDLRKDSKINEKDILLADLLIYRKLCIDII